jgi:hypothetical protein
MYKHIPNQSVWILLQDLINPSQHITKRRHASSPISPPHRALALSSHELLGLAAPPPLPRVRHPEQHRQRHGGGGAEHAPEHLAAVPAEARAVVRADGPERIPHERAVRQVRQHRAVALQPVAQVRRAGQLLVHRRRHAAGGGA